jgi:hypothetical protein
MKEYAEECKSNFDDDLNELNKKFDTEENRQCLTDLLGG